MSVTIPPRSKSCVLAILESVTGLQVKAYGAAHGVGRYEAKRALQKQAFNQAIAAANSLADMKIILTHIVEKTL